MLFWSPGEHLYADEPAPRSGSPGGGSHVPSDSGTNNTSPMPSNVQDFIQQFPPLAKQQFDLYDIPVSVQRALAGREGGVICNSPGEQNPEPVLSATEG